MSVFRITSLDYKFYFYNVYNVERQYMIGYVIPLIRKSLRKHIKANYQS